MNLTDRKLRLDYSLGHLLHHLRLDCAISEALSVEILALVSHSMASVTNYWDFNLAVIR